MDCGYLTYTLCLKSLYNFIYQLFTAIKEEVKVLQVLVFSFLEDIGKIIQIFCKFYLIELYQFLYSLGETLIDCNFSKGIFPIIFFCSASNDA